MPDTPPSPLQPDTLQTEPAQIFDTPAQPIPPGTKARPRPIGWPRVIPQLGETTLATFDEVAVPVPPGTRARSQSEQMLAPDERAAERSIHAPVSAPGMDRPHPPPLFLSTFHSRIRLAPPTSPRALASRLPRSDNHHHSIPNLSRSPDAPSR